MSWSELLIAFAIYLVLEGLLPFASPRSWREAVRQIAGKSDEAIRRMGLICMLCGVGLLYLVRGI